jgi:hypothetical protein
MAMMLRRISGVRQCEAVEEWLNLKWNTYGFTETISSRRSAASVPEGPYENRARMYRCEERLTA